MRKSRQINQIRFQGHPIQIPTNLAPTTIQKMRTLKLLLTVLAQEDIKYRWVFPFLVTPTSCLKIPKSYSLFFHSIVRLTCFLLPSLTQVTTLLFRVCALSSLENTEFLRLMLVQFVLCVTSLFWRLHQGWHRCSSLYPSRTCKIWRDRESAPLWSDPFCFLRVDPRGLFFLFYPLVSDTKIRRK